MPSGNRQDKIPSTCLQTVASSLGGPLAGASVPQWAVTGGCYFFIGTSAVRTTNYGTIPGFSSDRSKKKDRNRVSQPRSQKYWGCSSEADRAPSGRPTPYAAPHSWHRFPPRLPPATGSYRTAWSAPPPKRPAGADQVPGDAAPGVQGVRRRGADRWVCEVREPNKKSRIWVGTFPPPRWPPAPRRRRPRPPRRLRPLNFADSASLILRSLPSSFSGPATSPAPQPRLLRPFPAVDRRCRCRRCRRMSPRRCCCSRIRMAFGSAACDVGEWTDVYYASMAEGLVMRPPTVAGGGTAIGRMRMEASSDSSNESHPTPTPTPPKKRVLPYLLPPAAAAVRRCHRPLRRSPSSLPAACRTPSEALLFRNRRSKIEDRRSDSSLFRNRNPPRRLFRFRFRFRSRFRYPTIDQ
uniref:AP2/ERF domain-containing protein n=1 Tax=Ananas comosus var. bracteatus TaxID=296719 RepID=A0A6V7NSE8_ANACO|nr:unnamed protein product [Ananas comosus var. bracteatus]